MSAHIALCKAAAVALLVCACVCVQCVSYAHQLRHRQLLALLVLFLFVALGVLGRADLASLGVDACAALSFAFDYFAGGFWWHVYIYLT